jgi:oligosaccharide 4-alpha-D-glucosyltransferase
MKFRIFFALVFLSAQLLFAQSKSGFSGYINHTFDGRDLKINTRSGQILITPYNHNIIRVTYLDSSNKFSDSSYVLVSGPEPVKAKVQETSDIILLKTDSIQLTVDKKNLLIDFSAGRQKALAHSSGYFCTSNDTQGLSFQLNDTEALYGTGSRAIPLNRRGYLLENYHQPHYGYSYGEQNLNISVPLIISSAGYALYFENAGSGNLDLGKTNKDQLQYTTQSGHVSYFLIAGNNDEILNSYTQLTGKQPLPPRWALGFIQSRFGYKSAKETLETVKKTIAAGYPLDATVLDLFWYGDVKTMGNHDWRLDSFPQPEKMLAELKSMGVKTIPITQTFVTTLSDNFNKAKQADLFAKDVKGNDFIIADFWAGPTGLIDIFKPGAQRYLWNFYRQRINEGVAGWWCDLGEPEKHPDSVYHVNGIARNVHNVYPLIWAKTIFDGYRKDFPQQRVFNLARSGGAGMQRYSTFPWSGDVSRSWNGFKAQIPIMLGMSMSGIGYMHSDAGGFAQGEKDAELYIRWMEYAAFTPVYRAHADPSPAPPEPIFWDDATQKIVKEYIKLRYRFLPYNYTLAYQNTLTGRPLAMPLNYLEPQNKLLDNINDEYLWGEKLLIAPVIEKGKADRKVIFPKGNWVNWYTGEIYADSAIVKADLEHLPIFAKSGSFVPMAKNMQNTEKYTSDTLVVKYFPDDTEPAGFVMYQDNGNDPLALEKKDFELLTFSGYVTNKGHTIEMISTKPDKIRDIYFEIININKPTGIQATNGKKIKFKSEIKANEKAGLASYSAGSRTLKIHLKTNGEKVYLIK